MRPLLPRILAERRYAEHVELDLLVPRDLAHFEGHFPGLPILPGVVQIDWAVRLARQYLALDGSFHAAENIRFQAIIVPGTSLTLVLSMRAGRARLGFMYSSGAKKYSSGTLAFGEP